MREVDQATFAAAYHDGAVVVDAREPFEYAGGNRSLSAAGYLAASSLDSWSVAGGLRAGLRGGRPAVSGTRAAA